MRFAKESKAAIAEKISRIIFVEGKDDAYFINSLLEEISADPKVVGIIHLNGTGNLERELSFVIKSGTYIQKVTTHLAVLADADDDAKARTKRLNTEFRQRGLPEVEHARIGEYDSGRRLGMYVLPDGQISGELEDLLLATVSSDDRLATVSQALASVEAVHGALNKRGKRLARMYVSVLPIVPCGVGKAYAEGVFDKTSPSVEGVRNFLRLFIS